MTDHQREQFLLASEAHRRAKNANIMAAAATKAVIKHLGGPAEGHAIDHEIRTAATAYATSKEAIRLTVEAGVFGSDPLDLHVLCNEASDAPSAMMSTADLNLKIAHLHERMRAWFREQVTKAD